MRSTASGGGRSAFVLEFQLIRRDDQPFREWRAYPRKKAPVLRDTPHRRSSACGLCSVLAGLVPAIHALGWRVILSDSRRLTVWVAGTSPAKTAAGAEAAPHFPIRTSLWASTARSAACRRTASRGARLQDCRAAPAAAASATPPQPACAHAPRRCAPPR